MIWFAAAQTTHGGGRALPGPRPGAGRSRAGRPAPRPGCDHRGTFSDRRAACKLRVVVEFTQWKRNGRQRRQTWPTHAIDWSTAALELAYCASR